MWIVRFALQRPYTFVIVALLIAIFGIASILQTPTDILPDIDIPIVSVIWTYSGMDADNMSKRIVAVCERALPTTVNNIQYTESQSYSGVGVIKIHFQPGVQVDLAIAQVTALAQSLLRLMPTGILPPYVLKYDASSVPIVQVSMGGRDFRKPSSMTWARTLFAGSWRPSRAPQCRCPIAASSDPSWWTWSRCSWQPIT
jgi:multidrug efflux pump subunit AcrB